MNSTFAGTLRPAKSCFLGPSSTNCWATVDPFGYQLYRFCSSEPLERNSLSETLMTAMDPLSQRKTTPNPASAQLQLFAQPGESLLNWNTSPTPAGWINAWDQHCNKHWAAVWRSTPEHPGRILTGRVFPGCCRESGVSLSVRPQQSCFKSCRPGTMWSACWNIQQFKLSSLQVFMFDLSWCLFLWELTTWRKKRSDLGFTQGVKTITAL